MVIHANRDAWEECIKRANEALASNDLPRAKRLLHKAQKLDPSFDVNAYLASKGVNPEGKSTDSNYNHFDDHYDNAEGLRSRRRRFEKNTSSASANSNTSNDYSQANDASTRTRSRSRSQSNIPSQSESSQQDSGEYHVTRIRHCKDYYEVLQVSRDCDEITLKKKYRELALKLHPDKCSAPGATEAFKALGNAYSVLSDPSKREAYNASGMNPERMTARRSRGFEYDYSRGFEAEVTPEEIFEMFFGGGFPGGTVYRRRGAHFTRHHHHYEEQPEERSTLANLLQLLPLFVLLFGALFMQLLAGEPAFSLRPENGYTVQRFTKDLRVPYYVRPEFVTKYGDRVQSVEAQVEEEYISRLRMNCYREKNQRETALWRAKMSGDNALWAQAHRMELPNCRRLEEIYH